MYLSCLPLLLSVLYLQPASAPRLLDNVPWDLKTTHGEDAETGGWFINLGITGARAKILQARPSEFEIAYVFEDTPAAGNLLPGDRITGIANSPFSTPHSFGYGVGKFGYQGPMMEFADALESAESSGKLILNIIRDENKRTAELNIPITYGILGKTYPFECVKTDRILNDLLPWLAERQKPDGTWSDRPHLNAFAALSLLASGKKQYVGHLEKAARAFARSTDKTIEYGGLDCWKYGLYAIYLSEYYLVTKEEWVLAELEEISIWLEKAQISDGGWGHRPANRPGGNGYGSICILTMQAKMAMGLMAKCGVEINTDQYRAAHDFVVKGTGESGYVWYKNEGRTNPGYADMGRTGAAAIAHALSPEQPGYREYAQRAADCIGTHPDTFSDTHGSPILGMVWTAIGAGVNEDAFRKLMDHNRWWFTLARCPDGSFYYQPNRDNNPQDYTAAPRLSATAATALILTIKDSRLEMMANH